MPLIKALLARLGRREGLTGTAHMDRPQRSQFEILVRAQGDWLALLATILEREQVIRGEELARSLNEFAALTAADRPDEGRVLSFWASRLEDAAATFEDVPSVH